MPHVSVAAGGGADTPPIAFVWQIVITNSIFKWIIKNAYCRPVDWPTLCADAPQLRWAVVGRPLLLIFENAQPIQFYSEEFYAKLNYLAHHRLRGVSNDDADRRCKCSKSINHSYASIHVPIFNKISFHIIHIHVIESNRRCWRLLSSIPILSRCSALFCGSHTHKPRAFIVHWRINEEKAIVSKVKYVMQFPTATMEPQCDVYFSRVHYFRTDRLWTVPQTHTQPLRWRATHE